MSTSQIPNLNTLRRGGLRSRGRGRGPGPTGSQDTVHPSYGTAHKDDIIRNTDNDAAASRLSAVEAGYLDDPFAKLLTSNGEATRRLPLMNRGTYARTTAIDQIVDTFLLSKPDVRKQIISLGAGSDTRYFRLRRKDPELDLLYHELDFKSNTRTKIARFQSSSFVSLAKTLCQINPGSADFEVLDEGTRLRSPCYHIHPKDLREFTTGSAALPYIDTSLPTLLISECCLVYLTPTDADAVLQYFTSLFSRSTPLAIVIYEPIRPNDPFGRTMVSNLTARGIQLQTLDKYADLSKQKDRLRQNGFSSGQGGGAEAMDIDWVWKTWIDEQDKERVDALEWMDEVEEFVLLAQHYCVSFGWRGFEDDSGWRHLPVQK